MIIIVLCQDVDSCRKAVSCCVRELWSTVQTFQQFEEGEVFFCFSGFSLLSLIAFSEKSNRFFWRMLTQHCDTFIPCIIDRRNCHTKQSYQNHVSVRTGSLAVLPTIAVSGQSVKNPINLKPDVVCFLCLSSVTGTASCSHVALCSCLSDRRAVL